MSVQEIESEGFVFETRGDSVFVMARFWVEEWGPFGSDEEACRLMVRAVPALAV